MRSERRKPPADKALGVALPLPLSVRLDGLLRHARACGEPTSRRELVAALIEHAPRDGVDLQRLLDEFRTATVEAAILDGEQVDDYLRAERRPGPRARERAWGDEEAARPPLF